MPPVSAAVAAQVLQADPPCPSGYIVIDITKYVDLSSDGEAAYLRADWMPLLPALSYVTLVPSGESGLPKIFLRCDPSVWGRRLRAPVGRRARQSLFDAQKLRSSISRFCIFSSRVLY